MKKSIQEIRAEAELPLDLSQLPIRVTLDIPYCIDGNPAHTPVSYTHLTLPTTTFV